MRAGSRRSGTGGGAAAVPVSLEAKLRARSDAFLGVNYRSAFDDFDGSDTASLNINWAINGAATKSTAQPTSAEFAAGGDVVLYRRNIANPRTQKWHAGIAMKCAGTVASGETRGFGWDVGSGADRIFIGVNESVSATKFSAKCIVGSSVTASAASTVDYDNNWHFIEATWDLVGLYLIVDFGTPVLVTTNSAHLLAAGTLFEGVGNRAGNGITYIDAFYFASSRT